MLYNHLGPQQTRRQRDQGPWGFPRTRFMWFETAEPFKSNCLKSCPGGPDPDMGTEGFLVGKVKVNTAGSKSEDVWLWSELIAFPLLLPFDAAESLHQLLKVWRDGQDVVQHSRRPVLPESGLNGAGLVGAQGCCCSSCFCNFKTKLLAFINFMVIGWHLLAGSYYIHVTYGMALGTDGGSWNRCMTRLICGSLEKPDGWGTTLVKRRLLWTDKPSRWCPLLRLLFLHRSP